MRLTAISLALATACSLGASVRAQDAPTALSRAQRAYDGFQTLQASFHQVIENRMLGAPDSSRGTLFMRKPDRFAMNFAEPAGDRLVADGTWLWVYTPELVPGQVIRQNVPSGGAISPNLFAQFVDRAMERYEVTYRGREQLGAEVVDAVHLVPRAPAQFRWATVWVSRTSGLMLRVEIKEESGQTRTLDLSSIEPNARFPESEVEFEVPAHTRVVVP